MNVKQVILQRSAVSARDGLRRRRGVVAGAAALAAGLLLKASERVARAADGDPVLQGVANGPYAGTTTLDRIGGVAVGTSVTVTNDNGDGLDAFGAGAGSIGVFAQDLDGIAAVNGNSTSGDAVDGFTTTGIALFGSTDTGAAAVSGSAGGGTGDGVQGFSTGGLGVFGSTVTGAAGVSGTTAGTGAGVQGTGATGFGVVGTTATGLAGVRGSTTGTGDGISGVATGGNGVFGTATTGNGVLGSATAKDGVVGLSTSGQGVRGISTSGNGVLGQGSAAGVIGFSGVGAGIYGVATAPAAYAGYFQGRIFVSGAILTTGSQATALRQADGSYRLAHALETPDNLFEDIGTAQLQDGKASVALDPDFKALVHDDYHVFLTPYAETNGLFVASRTPTGFVVQEANGGRHSVQFSYRVVGTRADVPKARLERITLPASIQAPAAPPKAEPAASVRSAQESLAQAAPVRDRPKRTRPVRSTRAAAPAQPGRPTPVRGQPAR